MMIKELVIVGNQKIPRKVLKAIVHDERETVCWREQFDGYRRRCGK
jgi:hypothetical protein